MVLNTFAVRKSVLINIFVHKAVSTVPIIPLGEIPRNGITRSKVEHDFFFLLKVPESYCQIASPKDWSQFK